MKFHINWDELNYTVDDFGRTIYSFPVHIRVLIAMIVVFFVIILILLGIILSSRIYKTQIAKKKNELRKKYQPVFRNLLFGEDNINDDQFFTLFDKRDLRRKFHSQAISDEIIHLHENFTGETATRLEQVFRRLGFDQKAIAKLDHKKWYVAAKGIRELAQMNIKESSSLLYDFLNHKNQIMRMEARIGLMRLSEDDLLTFLTDENTIITDWDTANIHSMMIKVPEDRRPDFRKWLGSGGTDINLFSIRMIGAFRQHNAIPILTEMIGNRSQSAREKKAILKALHELNANTAETMILNLFAEEDADIQFEILKTLEKIGTEKCAPMLKKLILDEHTETAMAVQATRSLMKCSRKGVQYINELSMYAGPSLLTILQHAKDSRI